MIHALSPIVYGTLVSLGVDRLFRRRNRDRVVILAYHGLHAGDCDALENFDGLLLHVDRFARQMRFLKRYYHVVPLEECFASDAPSHRIVITFDDAYASVYTHAFPILSALRLPATVFVPTDFVMGRHIMWWDRLRSAVKSFTAPVLRLPVNGDIRTFPMASRADKMHTIGALHALLKPFDPEERERIIQRVGAPDKPDELHMPLTVQQMREMAAHGITFQSHSATHRSFVTLAPEEMWREARHSKRLIEACLGRDVTWFSYPFGESRPDAEHILVRSGYRGAVTLGRHGTGGRFGLTRLAIGDPICGVQFAAAVSGLMDSMASIFHRAPGQS